MKPRKIQRNRAITFKVYDSPKIWPEHYVEIGKSKTGGYVIIPVFYHWYTRNDDIKLPTINSVNTFLKYCGYDEFLTENDFNEAQLTQVENL